MKKYKITCVIGTRPEALKMIPVIQCLQQHADVLLQIVLTGQHRELLKQILTSEGIQDFIDFDVMAPNQSLNCLTSKLFFHFNEFLNKNPCDLLIAQGDTTTTLVAAIAGFHLRIPFAHVEAGLRTADVNCPFPEEFNRRATALASTLHFCPTDHTANNLKLEGVHKHVYVTGNTIIDMLHRYMASTPDNSTASSKKLILVTCHRRESFGEPVKQICQALKHLAQHYPQLEMLIPVHPNPNVKLVFEKELSNIPNIKLTPPLSYQELIGIMSTVWLILTDSGGIQEEAPTLKKPVLVLRDTTERVEAIACGASRLVGTEKFTIINAVEHLLSNPKDYLDMVEAGSPYGDGQAAPKIVSIIMHYLKHKN